LAALIIVEFTAEITVLFPDSELVRLTDRVVRTRHSLLTRP